MIDDTAVTPNYVTGFSPDRELPIVARIAWGSIRNKLLFLLPAALDPQPLPALGDHAAADDRRRLPLLRGRREGLRGRGAARGPRARSRARARPRSTPKNLEDEKVAGAIQTDFILSAEIMTIALATIPDLPFWEQAVVLAVVGIAITAAVYGVVALIVKADDIGPRDGHARPHRRRPRPRAAASSSRCPTC